MILGHSNPKIIKAIKDQADLGTSYGAPTEAETSIGELIKTIMPSIEKIRMVNSGTEATMSCIRLARGYTNRNTIIKFDTRGSYVGASDIKFLYTYPKSIEIKRKKLQKKRGDKTPL